MTTTSNRGFKSKTPLYMSLFFLLFSLFTSNVKAVTYYLLPAGVANPEDPSNWNDDSTGAGNALVDWATSGNTFVIRQAITATLGFGTFWDIGTTNVNQPHIFNIYGTLILEDESVMEFFGRSSGPLTVHQFNVYGTVQFEDPINIQLVKNSRPSLIVNFYNGANFISYNTAAPEGDLTPVGSKMTITYANGVNYQFYGANTSLDGLSTTVNNLTLSNSTGSMTLTNNLTINGTLSISTGTFDLAGFTVFKTGNLSYSTGTIDLFGGSLTVTGSYTHTSSTNLILNAGTLTVNGSLILTSGTLNVSSSNLILGGSVSRTSGLIHAPSANLTFTNSSPVTLPQNVFLTYPSGLTLNGSGGVTLGGKTTSLTDSLGTITFTNGNLTITSDTTAINGTTGTGGFIVSNSSATLKIYGSNSFTLRPSQTTPGVTNILKNVITRGTNSVSLGTALRISSIGEVSIGSGTVFTTNGLVTLISNASGHAKISRVWGTLASSSNDSMQLYIPGGTRGYRLFGNPFSSALAISQFMNSATEIDITGTGGNGNGFTTTVSNNPSAYSYNTSGNSWDPFTNTSQTIAIGAGAHILVRGIKGQGLDGLSYTPSASTIRLAGQFRSNTVVSSLSDGGFGWNLVANPYPSNIDVNLISSGNWSNVNNLIYGYDKVNRTYSACNKNGSSAVNNLSNIIEMGSSFLAEVNAAGAASITFTEDIKTSASSTVGGNPIFTPKDERTNRFKLQLFGLDENKLEIYDECLFSFGNVSTATDDWDVSTDAWDLGGEIVDIGIVGKNKNLAINEYPNLSTYTKTIHLNVFGKFNGTYKIDFKEESPVESGIDLFLRDKFKGEVHNIKNGVYTFEINDNELSYGSERFELFSNVTSNVQKIKSQNEIKIFPNPLTSSATEIDVFIAGEGHSFIIPRIYDLSGRLVFEGSKTFVSINKTNKISLPLNLNAQNYILTCETAQGIFNQQLTITE